MPERPRKPGLRLAMKILSGLLFLLGLVLIGQLFLSRSQRRALLMGLDSDSVALVGFGIVIVSLVVLFRCTGLKVDASLRGDPEERGMSNSDSDKLPALFKRGELAERMGLILLVIVAVWVVVVPDLFQDYSLWPFFGLTYGVAGTLVGGTILLWVARRLGRQDLVIRQGQKLGAFIAYPLGAWVLWDVVGGRLVQVSTLIGGVIGVSLYLYFAKPAKLEEG